jgi:hypothetical protein
MTKLQKDRWSPVCGLRAVVIFLLLAGWEFAGLQRADAQIQAPLDLTVSSTRAFSAVPAPLAARSSGGGGNFSTGRRIGAVFMNPLMGLGSYTMGDAGGGLFVSTGYGFAAGLILWDIFGLDYDSKDDYQYKIAGIPGLIGMGIAGGTTIFGVLRPLFYQNSPLSNENFSAGSRIGMAALNPLLGMGSYIMGDWLGGLIMSAGYGTALGLVAWDISAFENDPIIPLNGFDLLGIPGIVGAGVAGATVVFGIIRPLVDHRTGSSSKRRAEALKGVNLAVIPDAGGIAVHLGYSFQY